MSNLWKKKAKHKECWRGVCLDAACLKCRKCLQWSKIRYCNWTLRWHTAVSEGPLSLTGEGKSAASFSLLRLRWCSLQLELISHSQRSHVLQRSDKLQPDAQRTTAAPSHPPNPIAREFHFNAFRIIKSTQTWDKLQRRKFNWSERFP